VVSDGSKLNLVGALVGGEGDNFYPKQGYLKKSIFLLYNSKPIGT